MPVQRRSMETKSSKKMSTSRISDKGHSELRNAIPESPNSIGRSSAPTSTTSADQDPYSPIQHVILSFFDTFQKKDLTIMSIERLNEEASRLSDNVQMHLAGRSEESIRQGHKDVTAAIRHILLASLTSAANFLTQELKGRTISTEFHLFPAVMILRLVSVCFFNPTCTSFCSNQSISQIMTEIYDKLSSSSIDENIRSTIGWWLGTCLSEISSCRSTRLQLNDQVSRVDSFGSNNPSIESKDSLSVRNGSNTLESLDMDDRHQLYSHHYEQITTLLVQSMDNKSQKNRLAAIFASCSVLQTHSNPLLLHQLMGAMANDTSSHNRSSVICNIQVTDKTIPSIIRRIRDVNMKVRMDAIQALKSKADVLQLTPTQRVDILRYGLTPRCMGTFGATVDLLCCAWLKSMKFDPIALIHLLEPSNRNENVCEITIRTILAIALGPTFAFIDESITQNPLKFGHQVAISTAKSFTKEMVQKLRDFQQILHHELSEHEIRFFKERINGINVNLSNDRSSRDGEINALGLDPSSSLYIRVFCQMILKAPDLSDVQKSSRLANVLPDVPSLGEVLLDINSKIQDCMEEKDIESSFIDDLDELNTENDRIFTCRQVFHMLRCVDLSEEGSRRHFKDILQDMLSSIDTHVDILESCVITMRDLYAKDTDFIQAIGTILSIIETKYPASMREMTDVHRLDILSTALSLCSNKVSSSLSVLFDSFSNLILSMVVHDEAEFREVAVECLGRFVLLLDEKRVLDEFMPLLLEISRNSHERDEVRAQALMALCDLALQFQTILTPLDVGGSRSISYLQILESLLTSSNSSLLFVAAECIAKLHFVGRVHDSNLIAHLLIIYFGHDSKNFSNVEEVDLCIGSPMRLQQLLTVFFPVYGSQVGKATLIGSASIVENLISERPNSNRKGKKSTVFPISKVLNFIQNCTVNEVGDGGNHNME